MGAISREQLEALFEVMARRSKLKEIDLGHNNLAGVNKEILADGIKNVEIVKLYDTNLTKHQIERIITNVGNKMKTLDICFNLAIRETARHALEDAEMKIQEFSY